MPQSPQFPVHSPRVFLLRRGHPHHRPHPALARVVANQHREQLVTVQPVGLGPPRAAVDFNARRIHHDVVDTLLDEPAVQPEAVAPGLIAAMHARLRRKPATRLGLGDALEQRRGVPCRYRIAARAARPVAQRQLPILLTQFEGHVQLARFYRMLSLKGCSRRIHFALLPLNRVGRTLVLTQGGKSRTALHSIFPLLPLSTVGREPRYVLAGQQPGQKRTALRLHVTTTEPGGRAPRRRTGRRPMVSVIRRTDATQESVPNRATRLATSLMPGCLLHRWHLRSHPFSCQHCGHDVNPVAPPRSRRCRSFSSPSSLRTHAWPPRDRGPRARR